MANIRLGIIMHGVTGRMGMNQHLIETAKSFQPDLKHLNLRSKTGSPVDGVSDFPPTFLCARPGRTYNMIYNTSCNITLGN